MESLIRLRLKIDLIKSAVCIYANLDKNIYSLISIQKVEAEISITFKPQESLVMAFGLVNSSPLFQGLINELVICHQCHPTLLLDIWSNICAQIVKFHLNSSLGYILCQDGVHMRSVRFKSWGNPNPNALKSL